MIGRIHYRMLLAALGVSALSTVAQADELLCASTQFNPDTGENWGVVCAGEEWAYADVQVFEAESKISIHVTDHFDCSSGTHLECGFASAFDGATECVAEGSLVLPADGYLPAVVVFCGCYTNNCYGE